MAKNYLNEDILLQSLKNKDSKAFEYLFNDSRNRLFILVVSIVSDPEVAKDIVQEFFIDFWHYELYNKVRVSIKSYLYTALHSRALMHLRGERSYAKMIEVLTPYEYSETHYPLENEELRDQLNKAINKLPPMAQQVFRMHYIEHLPYADISNILGISQSTVGNHIDRALRGLRADLKKNR
jgi:RNA polymerase sigma-70 factor (family 1)